ncbi:hypothetical protein A6M14_04800 [Acinetobacter sp. Ac_877]|nr:hypothetical protein [Acinetobacter portensis]
MALFIRFFSIGILIAVLWIGLDTFYVHSKVAYTFSKHLDVLWYVFTYLLLFWGSLVLFKQHRIIQKYGFRLLTAFILWVVTLPIYMVLTLRFHVAVGWSL